MIWILYTAVDDLKNYLEQSSDNSIQFMLCIDCAHNQYFGNELVFYLIETIET